MQLICEGLGKVVVGNAISFPEAHGTYFEKIASVNSSGVTSVCLVAH